MKIYFFGTFPYKIFTACYKEYRSNHESPFLIQQKIVYSNADLIERITKQIKAFREKYPILCKVILTENRMNAQMKYICHKIFLVQGI